MDFWIMFALAAVCFITVEIMRYTAAMDRWCRKHTRAALSGKPVWAWLFFVEGNGLILVLMCVMALMKMGVL